jgi:hypothetical protein
MRTCPRHGAEPLGRTRETRVLRKHLLKGDPGLLRPAQGLERDAEVESCPRIVRLDLQCPAEFNQG